MVEQWKKDKKIKLGLFKHGVVSYWKSDKHMMLIEIYTFDLQMHISY